MSTFLYIVLAVIYITCFIVIGLATFRKGHYLLFWLGIIFPVLWIIGALMAPTPAALERERAATTGAP
jgi:hypothetical protein